MNKLIGDAAIDLDALQTMKDRGGEWYAYQNMALDSADAGRIAFLQCGEGRTFTTPPDKHPDGTSIGPGWKYLHVGQVDLETGEIK